MKNDTQKYSIAITFIWIGFVCAISFMKAWIKFQAPGITTKLGLSIGQLVFRALNKVEIVCAILLLIDQVFLKPIHNKGSGVALFCIPLIILTLQTLWLLPALNNRASQIIQGIDVSKSKLHLWYVLLEIVKVIFLLLYGFKLFSKEKINSNTIWTLNSV